LSLIFVAVAGAILVYPALYNGFLLTTADTGAYLAAAAPGVVAPGLAPAYGLALKALLGVNGGLWWLPVVLQGALVLWLLQLVRRSHGLSGSGLGLLLTTAFLVALTGLAWVTTLATPDLLVPVLVLALYLLVFRRDDLASGERLLLVLLLWFALAGLITNPALALLLLVPVIVLALPLWRTTWARQLYLAGPAVVLALGIGIAIPSLNALIDGKFRPLPGATGVFFSGLVENGVVKSYLDQHCQEAEPLKLCAYREQLPTSAHAWLTDPSSPLAALGGFDGTYGESRRIIADTVTGDPLGYLLAALPVAAGQLALVATGDQLSGVAKGTEAAIGTALPVLAPQLAASAQAKGELSFDDLNQFQLPLAWGAPLAALLLVPLLLWRRRCDAAELAVFVLAALVANAVVGGFLAGTSDLAGSRVAWLAVLAVLVGVEALLTARASQRVRAE